MFNASSTRRRLSPLLLCVFGIACRHPPPIRPEHAAVRTPEAHAYTDYGGSQEEVPGDLSPTLLIDDAVLTITPAEFCFDLTVRSPRWIDQALSMYEYECSVDGDDSVGVVRAEQPSRESGHPFIGPAPSVVIGTRRGGALEFPVGAAQEMLFYLVERQATVCCPAAPTSSLELTMSGRHAALRGSYVRLEWGWQLERR